MLDFILMILGIGSRGTSYSLARAISAYYWLVFILITTIGLISIGFGLNLLGVKGINLFLSLIFTITTIIIWSRPINLAIVAGIGAIVEKLKENQTFSQGAEKFLGYYVQLLQQALLWGSIILFFLGTLSFQENPKAFIGILTAIILTSLVKIVWGIGGELGKKFIYYYAAVMIAAFALTLIPSQLWIKVTGYDVKGIIHTSESEKIVTEMENLQEENADKKKVARLRQIKEKISRDETLLPSEKAFFKSVLEERQKNSIPAKISSLVPFGSSSQSQLKTKVAYYTPNAQPQDVYVGDGEWNFRIATRRSYYEVPKYGLTKARNTEVPATGKKCWDASILPYKNAGYYGGILANSLPNHSAMKSDNRGCVTISLNIPKEIKEVKASKKIKLVFTFIS